MPGIGGRLAELGIELPNAPVPLASYVPVRVSSGVAFVSGQLPLARGELLRTGSVPEAVSVEEAAECARLCGVNALAAAAEALGSVERVRGVVRVGVFVACGPGFAAHPAVANGVSELFQAVFGEAGRHARAAVGCSSLPLGAPVEVEVMFEVAE